MAEPLTCCWSDCGAVLSSVHELVNHINESHLENSNSENLCFWSGCERFQQPFHNRSSLTAHIRRHTGEKPFSCSVCNKSFSRSDALAKHVKSHTEIKTTAFSEEFDLNDCFNPCDYILKNLIMENLSLKRKLYFNDIEKKRIIAEKILLLDCIKNSENIFKSN